MAITPDGRTVYVASIVSFSGRGSVTPITTATNKAGKPITVGAGPSAVLVTP
jgi:YVTN family beta-propeller protein